MSDKSTFNMILKGDEGLSPPAGISMIHPDPKGPKTVAIFLLFGGILLAIFAYEDLVYSQLDDFTDEEVLAIIETPNSQGDNTKIINYHGRWSALSSNHFQKINKTMPDIESNRKYVNYIIDHVLEMPKLKESFFIQQLVMALDNGYILSEGKILPYGKEDATKILEVLFNNKKMLHQFLTDNTIIKQRDFLNYK